MPLKMLRTHAVHFTAGRIYSDDKISKSQRSHFLGNGYAVEVKDAGPSPENKMLAAAPENKRKRGRPRKESVHV